MKKERFLHELLQVKVTLKFYMIAGIKNKIAFKLLFITSYFLHIFFSQTRTIISYVAFFM